MTRRIASFPQMGKLEEDLIDATGIEYRSMVVISELVLLYTIYEDTVYIEFVKDARLDDATMLAKLSEEE